MRVIVEDGSGRIELVFFKGIKWMYGKLEPGREFIFFGKPTVFNGLVNMVHPEVDNLPEAGGSRMEKGRGAETEYGVRACAIFIRKGDAAGISGIWFASDRKNDDAIPSD